MSQEEEKWMDEGFDSMKGSQKARPRPELFAAIQDEIKSTKGTIIPLQQWRYVAAVAAVVFLLNVAAVMYFTQQHAGPSQDLVATEDYGQSLITSYQIYE